MAEQRGRSDSVDGSEARLDVVFEPDGDWEDEGLDGTEVGLAEQDGIPIGEIRDLREMTPDIENVSDEHPSEPPAGRPRGHDSNETPARTPIVGHETRGPGIRTGSSGGAALAAGSGGPAPRDPEPSAPPKRKRRLLRRPGTGKTSK
jgi:hypothetical protein